MKNKTWLATTLWLTLVCFGASAMAQNANDTPAVPPPKPKTSAQKPKRSAAKKESSKVAIKRIEAGPINPGPAVVTEKNVNVRGKAAINSEVIAHLKRGDHVQVLEEVVLKNPKTDEPSKWAKIALPPSTPVWVNATFLDASRNVVSKKLNLRSGPGENYSVVGQVTKGAAVKEVEAKGDWLRIEPPSDSYAFVAAHLISNDVGAGAPVLASREVPKPTVTAAPPPTTPTAPAVPPPAAETPVVSAKPPVIGAEPAGATPPNIVGTPVTAAPPPIGTPPPGESPVKSPQSPAPVITAPATPEPDEDVKRFVTREGIVKRSVSIQAPTYFVLENLSNGKTINYLFSTNLVLKDFKGQRVLVTGEEMLDERWPNTPVIAIDKLEPVPAVP